jgi:hypothetical protein
MVQLVEVKPLVLGRLLQQERLTAHGEEVDVNAMSFSA